LRFEDALAAKAACDAGEVRLKDGRDRVWIVGADWAKQAKKQPPKRGGKNKAKSSRKDKAPDTAFKARGPPPPPPSADPEWLPPLPLPSAAFDLPPPPPKLPAQVWTHGEQELGQTIASGTTVVS